MNFALKSKIPLFKVFSPNSNLSILNNANKLVCFQCVRWRHKPRWLPVAKTKMWRVPVRKQYPEEQTRELLTWFNHYRTEMKAIHHYLSEKTKQQETGVEVIAERLRLEEEKEVECMKLNDEWNASVAKLREARLTRQVAERKLKIEADLAAIEQKRQERLRSIEEAVRREKELSKTFITRDNIDEAIEKALNELVDFNFCIDLKGNVYKGLKARPEAGTDRKDRKIQAEAVSS